MENLYVWLLISAGAAIGLLGTFLFASERELSQKRRECEKLRSGSIRSTTAAPVEAQQSEPSAGLMAKNAALAERVSALSKQLQEGQKAVDELQALQSFRASAAAENERLQQTVASLTERLDSSEARFNDLVRKNQSAADRNASLESHIVELTAELESGRKRIEALQAEAQRSWFGVQSENRQLLAANQELERQLEAVRSEALTTNERYSASADQTQELREGSARLQSEIAGLKEELQASYETIEQLHAERARLKNGQDQNRRLKETVASLEEQLRSTETRFGESARQCRESDRPLQPEAMAGFRLDERSAPAISGVDGLQVIRSTGKTSTQLLPEAGETVTSEVSAERQTPSGGRKPDQRKQRGRVAPAIIALAITAVIALGFLGIRYRGAEKTVETAVGASEEYSSADEAGSASAALKPEPRMRGLFRITRPAQVFSSPSEDSALITSIEPGMKINVVDSRNGWLEIRSRHGRPPGFVRQEAAAKADQN